MKSSDIFYRIAPGCRPSSVCVCVAAAWVAFALGGVTAQAQADQTVDSAPARSTAKHPANHLAGETSPYLLLHVHNPVDWHPWGPEAFAKARAENKPIFLSIGYSSCFWCHVMERESFSDEEIAAYLNEHFVAIKVDREERPDVDDIYMTALQVYYQAVGAPQGGGWPLSMFLTPAGKPMMGGTYFPPRDVVGRPGFLSVVQQVRKIWSEHQTEILGHADLISDEVRRIMEPAASEATPPLARALVHGAVAALQAEFDPEYGGVDFDPQQPVGPKFPVPSRLMLLQSQIGRPLDGVAPQEMVDSTLEQMRRGGIFDHLGGGFHRYSTDRRWRVPHFEKMLYDNAQLAELYAEAYRRTNRKAFRDVAEQTYEFVLRELTSPDGAFYSALDAETDGIEGKFYVWSPEEVETILGADEATLFATAYGLDQPEFFEHGYVLHLPRPLDETADRLNLPASELRSRLGVMREKLLAIRQDRPSLLRDDKILTSWNGLMIRSLARGGEALGRTDLVDAAEQAAAFLLANLRDDDGRLMRTHRAGTSKLNAYLDDYAFLVEGLLALHQSTGKAEWLTTARQLTDAQLAMYWDATGHGFYFTSDQHEELLARTKNAYDSVIPAGNSVSVRNLSRLAQLTGEVAYRDRARETLVAFASQLQARPTGLTTMALALDEYLTAFGDEGEQVTAAKPPAASGTQLAQASSPAAGDDEPLVVAGRTSPRDRDAKVAAKVYLAADKLTPGGETGIAILLEIKDGWHINTNPPSEEFLIPTEVSAETQLKTELTGVTYPKGHPFRMKGFDDPISVYEGQVLLTGRLKVPAGAAGQTEQIELSVGYQACDESNCLRPTTAQIVLPLPIAGQGERAKPINQRLFRKPAAPPR